MYFPVIGVRVVGILYGIFLYKSVDGKPRNRFVAVYVFRGSWECVYEKNLTNPAKCGCKSVDSDRSEETLATRIPGGYVSTLQGSHKSVKFVSSRRPGTGLKFLLVLLLLMHCSFTFFYFVFYRVGEENSISRATILFGCYFI